MIPVEYAGRYRDALGVPLPVGLPESLVAPAPQATQDLARRFARTHGPFTTLDFAERYALGRATGEAILKALSASSRLLEGEFRPGGTGREWCDPDVLQSVRRRSLARLRKEVEPVEPAVFGRLLTSWQGVSRPRLGLDALLDAIENLQGAPLPASIFESEILSARVLGYNAADLDALTAAGEVTWCGLEPLGDRDGRLALFLTDSLPRLWRRQAPTELSSRERAILTHLESEGASFFGPLHDACGGGYPGETVDAIWDLVWKGLLTNDTFHALRAFTRPPRAAATEARRRRNFRSRRVAPPSSEGRWSLVADRAAGGGFADRMVHRNGAATSDPIRRADARGRWSGRHRGRLQRGVRRAESHGGCRPDPPRLLRRRGRRDPVRAPCSARADAVVQAHTRRS